MVDPSGPTGFSCGHLKTPTYAVSVPGPLGQESTSHREKFSSQEGKQEKQHTRTYEACVNPMLMTSNAVRLLR